MLQLQSAPVRSVTACATFLLAQAAPSLSLLKNSAWTRFNALHAFAHADGHYHLMGCMLSAASCNKWWMDEIIGTKDYAKEQAADHEAWRKSRLFPAVSDGRAFAAQQSECESERSSA